MPGADNLSFAFPRVVLNVQVCQSPGPTDSSSLSSVQFSHSVVSPSAKACSCHSLGTHTGSQAWGNGACGWALQSTGECAGARQGGLQVRHPHWLMGRHPLWRMLSLGSLGSHPLDTLQPPSLQLMTQRGEPLQQHPAQVGKLSIHAHNLLCPTGVINHSLRRALGSEQCHLGEGWHRSSQIVPLFLSTESSIEMFCSSELLEFLFWKSRPPQMCSPPWVIV